MTAITEQDNRPSRIMVVDDDPAGLGIMATHLKMQGFRVVISDRERDKPSAHALSGLVGTYRFDIIQKLLEGD